MVSVEYRTAVLLCKAERQYLLTLQVSRYCLLSLRCRVLHLIISSTLATLRQSGGSGAVVKAACLESRGSRTRPPLWQYVSKKQNVSIPLTRKDSVYILGSPVIER